MTRLLAAIGICLAVLSLPALATAQPGQPPPPPPPGSSPAYGYGAYGLTVPGVHEHEGFFLRLNIGAGYLRATTEVLDEDLEVRGPSGILQLALGGNISPGLILFGELFGHAVVEPTVEFAGQEVEDENATAGIGGVGVGLAYYLPANVYFSGTLAIAQLRRTEDTGDVERESETEFGPAMLAQIGKEWWVSDNWGLGLAGQFILSSNDDNENVEDAIDVTWTTLGFGLLFSATYD